MSQRPVVSSQGKVDDAARLHIDDLDTEYNQGDILAVNLSLDVRALCLFDPVLRLYLRRPGDDRHLLGTDSHQGGFFYPWLPRGNYRFTYQWPVSLPAGCFELCVSWGDSDNIRAPDLVVPLTI